MAKVLISPKGFKLIECTCNELVYAIGGGCVCDSCNTIPDTGVIVSALNGWYCQRCFKDWHDRAINTDKDNEKEEIYFQRFKYFLNT